MGERRLCPAGQILGVNRDEGRCCRRLVVEDLMDLGGVAVALVVVVHQLVEFRNYSECLECP